MRPTCTDCKERPSRVRGLCSRCYARNRNAGTLPERTPSAPCMWPKCGELAAFNRIGACMGFCRMHYAANISRIRLRATYEELDRMLAEGRRTIPGGYVEVIVDGKWRLEHRVVMEGVLGRELTRGESVHHKNGIRSDNSPENLELWVGPIRYGQRASDIRCHACGEPYRTAVTGSADRPGAPRRNEVR